MDIIIYKNKKNVYKNGTLYFCSKSCITKQAVK